MSHDIADFSQNWDEYKCILERKENYINRNSRVNDAMVQQPRQMGGNIRQTECMDRADEITKILSDVITKPNMG